MHQIIIDTDLGIDDALALFLALNSPEIKLKGITTVSGNVHVKTNTQNALSLLELTGYEDIPVAQGCDRPLIREFEHAEHIHGENGLGNASLSAPHITPISLHAVDFVIEEIMHERKMITLVCIAPLTNVALALRREPRIAEYVKEVVIMGGALRVPGNVTPAAEYNIYADPHAAYIVFHAGWPIRLVPLDITNFNLISREQIMKLPDNPITHLVKQMLDYYFRFGAAYDKLEGFPMHDPTCIGVILQPDLVTWESTYVDVELNGNLTQGATLLFSHTQNPSRPTMQTPVKMDSDRFARLFLDRIQRVL
jgi:purine nucleosidase